MGIIEKVRRFYCHRCGFVTYDENTLLSDKVKFIASEQQAATTEICEQRTADKLRWEVDKRKSEVAAAVRACRLMVAEVLCDYDNISVSEFETKYHLTEDDWQLEVGEILAKAIEARIGKE